MKTPKQDRAAMRTPKPSGSVMNTPKQDRAAMMTPKPGGSVMKTKKLVTLALLTTVAMMLSYVEAMIPSLGVPGVKMGLANIVIIFVLYRLGAKEAALISLLRVILMGFIFTSVSALLYSLAGAVLSLAGMAALKKFDCFSTVGVSVTGGVLHNAGQILVAMAVLETTAFTYYFPVLALSGTISGILIGLCGAELVRRVPAKYQ